MVAVESLAELESSQKQDEDLALLAKERVLLCLCSNSSTRNCSVTLEAVLEPWVAVAEGAEDVQKKPPEGKRQVEHVNRPCNLLIHGLAFHTSYTCACREGMKPACKGTQVDPSPLAWLGKRSKTSLLVLAP